MKKFVSGLIPMQKKDQRSRWWSNRHRSIYLFGMDNQTFSAKFQYSVGKEKARVPNKLRSNLENSIYCVRTFGVRHLEECVSLPHLQPEYSEIAKHWL